jgi:pyruvate dehydrogenase E2 component (dihydrolipoamide acetyltransferase)
MSIEVKLPELGDGIDSADVLEVLVREGDTISKDQGIVEVETDKATVQVPSSHAGVVDKILVSSGDRVTIGQALVSLETSSADSSGDDQSAGGKQEPAPAKSEAKEEKKEPLTKAEEPAAAKPAQKEVAQKGEESQPVKDTTEKRGRDDEESDEPQRTAEKPAVSSSRGATADNGSDSAPSRSTNEVEESADTGGVIAAGPAVRRFAREVGVDLRKVRGSGPGGRITREDILGIVRSASQVAQGKGKSGQAVTESDHWGPIRRERLSKVRRTIANKMHESWTAVPRVTNFDDADVTELERIRQSSKHDYASKGIKLTALPFVVKAVAMALKAHPQINASLDGDEVIYKDYVNIGIAVDSERGLVVPVLRNVDTLSIPEIARGLAGLAEKVRDNNYSIEDLRGGTFTISNLGAIGGTYSTPIVNVPEVAILLVGRSRKQPIVIDDEVKIRLMMPLSLSYDHRLVDGAAAGRYLNDVISFLTAPSRLLLAP